MLHAPYLHLQWNVDKFFTFSLSFIYYIRKKQSAFENYAKKKKFINLFFQKFKMLKTNSHELLMNYNMLIISK